ncbi:50S ribosome-binding GTPase [Escherichia coli]|nr:YfjP family GTPase [Escherichia coli]MBD3100939.1 50S ribosome-binding GTPase [Escherichia coli]
MSFSHSSLSAQVKSYLTFLPEEIRQKILEHLHSVIHYEPVIGIMGKSGAGKSSLCNAIFQSRVCATHPLNGCTRQAHRLTFQPGERRMTLVDLPGTGETPQHDQEYRALYSQLLPELDLIIWILRADERAYAADIAMHQFLLNEGADPSRFLFVLSHADRVFPAEEWNDTEKCPSRHQELSLATVTARVATLFPSSFPVLPVAAPVGWNIPALVSLMIHALPPPARQALAQAALTYRYGDEHQPVTTADILTPRRREDYGKDLWSAYQTIQENMLKGGISGRSAKGKRIHTRAIHSIDTDIKLNRALWVMAETLLESMR